MFAKPLYKMTGRELEAAAKAGKNPEALLALATMIAQGWRGLDGDEDRALELEKMAASMGHPRALSRLGDRYSRGDVVEEDHAQAILWWRRAAEAGDVDAMSNLIDLRESDNPRERAEGEHWLKLAASRGQPYALTIVNGGTPSSLADFAKMSLEDMAAAAPAPSGNELSWEREDVRASIAQINDLVIPYFYNLSNTANTPTANTTDDPEYLRRLYGVYAQANFAYKNYLFLSASARNDWSSTLPVANRIMLHPDATWPAMLSRSFPGLFMK